MMYHIGVAKTLLEAGIIQPGIYVCMYNVLVHVDALTSPGVHLPTTTTIVIIASFSLHTYIPTPGVSVLGGSSSGSLVATALAAGIDLGQLKQFVMDMANDSQQRLLGPLGLM